MRAELVLVDTSVWLRFLSDRFEHLLVLDKLLSQEAVSAHPLIKGELLIGSSGGRGRLLSDYALLRQAPLATEEEVADFVLRNRLYGIGLSWTDAHLLASTKLGGSLIWTYDDLLNEAASRLQLNFVPPP